MKKQAQTVENDSSVGAIGSDARAVPMSVTPVKAGATRFLVRRGGSIAKNGVVTRIPEGHIVRLSAYGQDGLKLMRENGIQLDPLED